MAERSVVVKLKAEVESFRRAMAEAQDAADKTSKKWEGVGKAGVGLAAVGGTILAGVGLAVKAYADFDEQMSKVQSATHASASDMEQLRAVAIKAGADTAFSAKEAAQGIEELSKAGVSTKDILAGGLTGALSLAAAGGLEVGDAAELAATALTQFKLSGEQVPHVADLLAAGAGKAQGSVGDLGYALKQSGLVASQYGLSIEETVGGLSAFASAGLIGSDAGTSFKTMLQSLNGKSAEAQSKMRELGFSAFDANGNLKSLTDISENLRQSMKDLTPEQRTAAMSIIFGSDAVRAASVLYEQGADGIQSWINKVNDAGYAAATAAIAQDNLKGDIEKLGGSIDSVFLKSGSGVNDVLRSWAQAANHLVDSIGSIPQPMLQASLGIAAATGGLALLVGGALVAIPKIMEMKAGWDAFSESNAKLAGSLKSSAKAAGIALAAFAALQVVGAIVGDGFDKAKGSTDAWGQQMLKMEPKKFDTEFKGISDSVNGVGDAFGRLGNQQWYDPVNKFLGDVTGMGSVMGETQRRVDGLSQTMSRLVGNGGLDRAGQAFSQVAKQADESAKAQGRSGMSTQQVLDLLPDYKSSLQDLATSMGYQASDADLLVLASGRIPPAMKAQADATGNTAKVQQIQTGISDDQAKALAKIGLNADGTTASLSKLLDAMFATGLAAISADKAESDYQAALDEVDQKAKDILASVTAQNHALNESKTAFDLTSPAGRSAAGVFDDVASKAITTTKAMADNGATQGQLPGKLGETYNSLIATAGKFGITGDAADTLARKALGIPQGVPIDVAIQNYADAMAKLQGVQSKADGLNGKVVGIQIQYTETGTAVYDRAQSAGNSNKPAAYASGGKVQAFSTGGRVNYLASGGLPSFFRPNGTDTEPAMLTPGEQVIKVSSARSLGYENLAIANATGRWPGDSGGGNTIHQTNYISEAHDGARVAMDVTRRLSIARA